MDSFFSKASSFVTSQLEHEAPPPSSHGEKVAHTPANNVDEGTRNPSSSGGYGDLLAGAQALMGGQKQSSEEGKSHKSPSSGGYGDLLASAQSLMGAEKSSGGGEGKTHESLSSGGYGDLLASAQSFMGTAKLSGGGAATDEQDEVEVPHKTTSSGGSGYADAFASVQVLMGAAKIGSRDGASKTDMGEVAGAASNLIDTVSHYGNIEKTSYGEYVHKAQSYLHDYQVSHSKTAPQGSKKPSASQEKDEEGHNPSNRPQATPVNSGEGTDEEGFNPPSRTPVKPNEEYY